MELIFKPFDKWPQASSSMRKVSPFKQGWNDTVQILDHELRYLKADRAVLQIAVKIDDIRLDGSLRPNREPDHPGVILSFESKHGPLQYLCDDCISWRHNVRAIALTLERLRLAELYGVAKRGEQYKGWNQLPAPGESQSIETALYSLGEVAGWTRGAVDRLLVDYRRDHDIGLLRDIYTAAILKAHPDKGGAPETFSKVQQARETLGL
jgi:hypothetical protein